MDEPLPGRFGMAADWRRAVEDHADARPPVRAWALGWVAQARGRYGEALAALDAARTGAPIVRAAARATRAALLRQVGLHEAAEVEDAAGVAALGEAPPGPVRDDVAAGLAIGTVADAVGRGDREAQHERLEVARAAVDAASERQRARLGWVTGEVALVADDPEGARLAFTGAVERAARMGWPRHEAKALVFLAAAETLLGERRAAITDVRRGLALAGVCDARPLIWPAQLVLAPLVATEGADGPHAAERHRRAAARQLDQLLETLPAALQTAARAAPDARALLG